MKRLRVAREAVLVVAMCVLVGSHVAAQTTGVIEGRVVDGTGAPVPGAAVMARHTATDTGYTVKTDEVGHYSFPALPPGKYEVTTITPPSLERAILVVDVTMGSSSTANFDPSSPRAALKRTSRLSGIDFEVSGRLGWTFSDGVSGKTVEAADGNAYNRIDPVDSVSWGFTFGVFVSTHLEFEFLFDRQQSTLQVGGTNTIDIADLAIGNYHGLVSYNFGPRIAPVRAYAFGGVGGTSYGSLTFTDRTGRSREIGGRTRLSTTFGGGVKIYRGPVGARVEGRLTPTYIKSNAVGWWCDEYWGCYVVEDSQYSNQFQFSGGVTFRF